MTAPTRQLSIDAAIGEFQAVLDEELGDSLSHQALPPETPEQAEDRRFRLAEYMIALACPDPRACADQRCRRDVLCRHLSRVHAKRASGRSSHPRRTPGAEAARYAIWVYMNCGK